MFTVRHRMLSYTAYNFCSDMSYLMSLLHFGEDGKMTKNNPLFQFINKNEDHNKLCDLKVRKDLDVVSLDSCVLIKGSI